MTRCALTLSPRRPVSPSLYPPRVRHPPRPGSPRFGSAFGAFPRAPTRPPAPTRPLPPATPRRFDLSAAASSNWRETAKTRERARSAETELASANETIRTLQAKMMLMETRLGGEKRQLADEGAKLRGVIAEDTARHDARLDAAKRDHDARYDELAERHARARAELASLHATMGRAAGGARGVTDLDTELQTEREAQHVHALEKLEHTLRSEATHAYETLEKAKDAQIKNLKEQSEYFLKSKDREIRELRQRADARERETTAETARLNAQVEYLHRWALSMNQIIRKVEDGSYRVAERSGVRTLAIPAREKPASLDVQILADRADAARAFLEEMETMSTTMTTVRGGADETTLRGADGADDGSAPFAGGAETIGAASTTAPGDAFEMESFRRHGRLVDEERAAVQEATLKELSAHPTVEYIRHLEEENRRVVRELSKERRSVSDMRVALNSARRARQKDAVEFARAASASARARSQSQSQKLSNATTGVLFGASTTLRGTGGANLAAGFDAREPTRVAFGATTIGSGPGAPDRPPFKDSEGEARTQTTEGLFATSKPDKNANEAAMEERYYAPRGSSAANGFVSGSRATNPHPRATSEMIAYANGARTTAVGTGTASRSRSASASVSPRRGRTVTSAKRVPLGGTGGRKPSDRVPVAGRPLSGSAEVGYGYVLGDGPDGYGGAVGWPAGADRGVARRDGVVPVRSQSARGAARPTTTQEDYAPPGARAAFGSTAARPLSQGAPLPTIEASGNV
jgi:hypothetical protein